MGERKVLNKYYPHDFDPSKVPRRRRPENEQSKVRMMLPMTVRCGACGEYLGAGTKFNARMEDVPGERYLGAIRVFRFYIRCSRCSAEIAFKTDPRNSGYALESGASAARGVLQVDAMAAARDEKEEEEEDGGAGAMAALERRARDGRREMDADAALEEARSLNARRARVPPEQALEALLCRRRRGSQAKTVREEEQDAEDEALVRSIRFRNSAGYVKRIEEGDDWEREEEEEDVSLPKTKTMPDHQAPKNEKEKRRHAPVVLVSKRRCLPTVPEGKSHDGGHADKSEGKASACDTKANNGVLQVLCCSYDDSDQEET